MLIKGNDVIGLKVVTLHEGKLLGKVEDIVYDPYINKVRAVVLDSGGFFREAKVVMLEDVHSIGHDAVVIISERVVRKTSEVTERVASIANNNKNLTRTRIITDSGNELGRVSDLIFDTKTGHVGELEVTQGIRDLQSGKKTVKVDQILAIGEDVTLVNSDSEKYFEEQANKQGVQGAIYKTNEQFKEETPKVVENMRAKAQDLGQEVEERAREFKESPQTKTFMQNFEEKTGQLRDRLRNMGRDEIPRIDLSELEQKRLSAYKSPNVIDDLAEKRERERLGYTEDLDKPAYQTSTKKEEYEYDMPSEDFNLGNLRGKDYDKNRPIVHTHRITVKKKETPKKFKLEMEDDGDV
jgi:uncharacterized protein YrrD